MKQGKRLTYDCKRLISAQGMNPNDWQIKQEDNESYTLIHKETKEIKRVEK